MSNQWGLRFSPRGLRFSQRGLRFSPLGLRFSPRGLRFSPWDLRFSQGGVCFRPCFSQSTDSPSALCLGSGFRGRLVGIY